MPIPSSSYDGANVTLNNIIYVVACIPLLGNDHEISKKDVSSAAVALQERSGVFYGLNEDIL
jgi:hypothetical protein